jgi:hypothetical protein
VANGVYNEAIEVNRFIALIGNSSDSTIISSYGISSSYIVRFSNNGVIKNFRIIGSRGNNFYQQGLNIRAMKVLVEDCVIENLAMGIVIFGYSESKIKSCLIKNFEDTAIWDESTTANQRTIYEDNIIVATRIFSGSYIVDFGFGGYQTFVNNIIFADKNVTVPGGIHTYTNGIKLYNNAVANIRDNGLLLFPMGSENIINNVVFNTWGNNGSAILTGNGAGSIIKNNILMKSKNGIEKINSSNVRSDYNLFFQNNNVIIGQPLIGDSNLVNKDPMFVNDTVVTLTSNWDYHLQAFSPAIDKGDPTILDLDGSRSDIGMYGGPYGEVYTYQDLAPRPPRNLSAIVDSGRVRIKWNKNTESDTSHYRIYRSVTPNFIIDSTKLIGTTKDTNYTDILTQSYQRLYYKITCVDKQGNQSKPSEELMVNLTSINEYPTVVNDYYLYQNYPNPFNGSTIISYKLKERGYVKLMVYDIKGERVAVLVNEEKEAGYYEVEFDANSLQEGNRQLAVGNSIASGIYLYRIEVIGEGNIPVYTEMRKMALVK